MPDFKVIVTFKVIVQWLEETPHRNKTQSKFEACRPGLPDFSSYIKHTKTGGNYTK
jgi:hypothetical protein